MDWGRQVIGNLVACHWLCLHFFIGTVDIPRRLAAVYSTGRVYSTGMFLGIDCVWNRHTLRALTSKTVLRPVLEAFCRASGSSGRVANIEIHDATNQPPFPTRFLANAQCLFVVSVYRLISSFHLHPSLVELQSYSSID